MILLLGLLKFIVVIVSSYVYRGSVVICDDVVYCVVVYISVVLINLLIKVLIGNGVELIY